MEEKIPKLYQGIIAFLMCFIFLRFVAPFVGFYSPLFSLISIQFAMGIIAFGAAYIFKVDFKTAFPFKLPAIRHVFGAIFLYAGVYLLTLNVSTIMSKLFPDMIQTIEEITFMSELMPNMFVAVILMAVFPAVFEELIMRGFILSTFSNFNEIIASVSVGVMFGVLHFDVYRFVPTALLGTVSAYVTIRSKTLILPIAYHFFNNLMSVIAMYQLRGLEDIDFTLELYNTPLISFGMIFDLVMTMILCYIGIRLFNEKRAK